MEEEAPLFAPPPAMPHGTLNGRVLWLSSALEGMEVACALCRSRKGAALLQDQWTQSARHAVLPLPPLLNLKQLLSASFTAEKTSNYRIRAVENLPLASTHSPLTPPRELAEDATAGAETKSSAQDKGLFPSLLLVCEAASMRLMRGQEAWYPLYFQAAMAEVSQASRSLRPPLSTHFALRLCCYA